MFIQSTATIQSWYWYSRIEGIIKITKYLAETWLSEKMGNNGHEEELNGLTWGVG